MILSVVSALAGCSFLAAPGLSTDEIEAAVSGMCDHDSVLSTYDSGRGTPLVRLDRDLPSPELAVSMEITEEGWIVDGTGVSADPKVLREVLDFKAESARDLSARTNLPDFAFTGELLLYVAPTVPVSTLLQVMATAHRSSFEQLSMVVRLRPIPEPVYFDPDYASELIAEQEALMRPNRAVNLSKPSARHAENKALVARCPKVGEAMMAVASASAEHKCQLLTEGLIEALPSCSRADGVKILTGMQVAGRPGPWQLGVVKLRIDPNGTTQAVDPSATWAEVAPVWVELPQTPVWFVDADDLIEGETSP